jgi:hypothetical protein
VDKKLNKKVMRAGVLTAVTTVLMLVSSPAFALNRDDGDGPGDGLTVAQTLGLYVAIPLVAFGVIAGLVIVTDKSRKDQ